jgi:hypothetical protein
MIIVNEIVEHIMFGLGIIAEVKDSRILVKFQDEVGTKMFLYPEAFESFLKAVNPKVESYVLEELRIKQEQIEFERKEKEREAAELEEKMAKVSTVKKKRGSRSMKKKS